jgi:hypothetical protein
MPKSLNLDAKDFIALVDDAQRTIKAYVEERLLGINEAILANPFPTPRGFGSPRANRTFRPENYEYHLDGELYFTDHEGYEEFLETLWLTDFDAALQRRKDAIQKMLDDSEKYRSGERDKRFKQWQELSKEFATPETGSPF